MAALSGCANHRGAKKNKAAAAKPAPLLVGTVKLVNEEGHFVLIDSEARPSPLAGVVLKTEANGGTPAELKAGEIRRRPFAIADIVSGTPKVGDRVYQSSP